MSAPSGMAPPRTKISGYKQHQVPTMNEGQMNLLSQLIQSLTGGIGESSDYLSKLASGNEELFQDLERPAYTAFEKLLGQTGTRFSDLGARDSSYFENAVAGQGAELAQNLQSQRLGLRQKAIDSLLGNAYSLLGQRPYENVFQKKEKRPANDWGALGQLGGSLLGGLGGFALGGPGGAALGASAGSSLGSGIGGAFTR